MCNCARIQILDAASQLPHCSNPLLFVFVFVVVVVDVVVVVVAFVVVVVVVVVLVFALVIFSTHRMLHFVRL